MRLPDHSLSIHTPQSDPTPAARIIFHPPLYFSSNHKYFLIQNSDSIQRLVLTFFSFLFLLTFFLTPQINGAPTIYAGHLLVIIIMAISLLDLVLLTVWFVTKSWPLRTNASGLEIRQCLCYLLFRTSVSSSLKLG